MTRRTVRAYPFFFGAAALFAVVAVPAWTLVYAGVLSDGPWADSLRHGHEMLFGYALAVVGGFLFTKISSRVLLVAGAGWLAGRLAMVVDGTPTAVTAAALLAFPVCLFWVAGIPFLRVVRSAHNAVFAPLLGAFMLADTLYLLGRIGVLDGGGANGVLLALDLVALLLFMMGGRIISATTAGALREGGLLRPNLEWAGIVALAVSAVLDAAGLWPFAAGLAAIGAGACIAVRLAGWMPGRVLRSGRSDLVSLHIGYAWLGAGLLLKGAAQLGFALPLADALHGVAVGALGTLSISMMARTALQRSRVPIVFPPSVIAALIAVNAAAVLRLAAWGDARGPVLVASAAAWTVAFAFLTIFLASTARSAGR